MTDTAIQDNTVVERDALLFRAGSYPDRDIEVTEQDLDRMIENHTPAPIKVEHTDTPLRFGVVTKIWRVGRELFGRLAFNPLAWSLAQQCGATKLSVAVRRDKSGLQEVSLVRAPRIADAAVFSQEAEYFAGEDLADAAAFNAGETDTGGGDEMERDEKVGVEEVEHPELPSPGPWRGAGGEVLDQPAEFAARVSELEKELRSRDVDAKIDQLKRQGKLAPSAEAFARSLLMAADDHVVTFADPASGTETREQVAKTFEMFLEAQPKVIEFSELAPGSADEKPAFSAQDERLLEKLGVSPETVQRHRERNSES